MISSAPSSSKEYPEISSTFHRVAWCCKRFLFHLCLWIGHRQHSLDEQLVTVPLTQQRSPSIPHGVGSHLNPPSALWAWEERQVVTKPDSGNSCWHWECVPVAGRALSEEELTVLHWLDDSTKWAKEHNPVGRCLSIWAKLL